MEGSGTPARAALRKTNELLNAALGIFIAFDFNACEECNVDTLKGEAEGSARSSACAGVDDLDGKWVHQENASLLFLSFYIHKAEKGIQKDPIVVLLRLFPKDAKAMPPVEVILSNLLKNKITI